MTRPSEPGRRVRAARRRLTYTTDVSWPVEKVLEEALKLDPKDRALIVAELSHPDANASPEEVEAAWREEIACRLKSIEDGTAELVDGHEVSQRIRAEYES